MPYVRRDAQGDLLSLHRVPEPGADEWLDDGDPQLQAFGLAEPADSFERLDAEFIRVLEDLIDALVRRRVLNLTDLPAAARHKLMSRKGNRAASVLTDLNLLGESPDGESEALQAYRQSL